MIASSVRSLSASPAANAIDADPGRVQDAEQVLAGPVTGDDLVLDPAHHAVDQAVLRDRAERRHIGQLLAREASTSARSSSPSTWRVDQLKVAGRLDRRLDRLGRRVERP